MTEPSELVERLRDRDLPPIFAFVGKRVEDIFDSGNRHKSGAKANDYLAAWLSMLRPFAFATKDDSWGEMEKLLCIVMRNYVEVHRMLPEAADRIEALSAMPDPLAMAKAQLSDDGPQPFIVAPRLTCTGCRHLKTKWWKDYLDNDETDSGTSARCGALPDEYGGKSITAYWTDNRSPPSWCPRAIDLATLEVNRATD